MTAAPVEAPVHGNIRKVMDAERDEYAHGHEGIEKTQIQCADPEFHNLTFQFNNPCHAAAES